MVTEYPTARLPLKNKKRKAGIEEIMNVRDKRMREGERKRE